MIAWLAISFQSLAWLFFLYLIGALILLGCKVRNARIFTSAPIVTVAVLGILTLGSTFFSWTIPNVTIILLCFVVLVFLMRLAIDRRSIGTTIRIQIDTIKGTITRASFFPYLAILVGVIVAFGFTVWVFSKISLESPIGIQNYDNPFHFSVVRHIVQTGVASPIGAGSVMGDAHAIYPSLWHAFVVLNAMLFDTSFTSSAWTICILSIGLIAPIGSSVLVKILIKKPSGATLFLAAVLPAITARSLFEYLTFGSLFANLLGLAFVPMAIAFVLSMVRATEEERCAKRVLAIFAACLICILSLGLAHPSTVFILFIFLVPYAIATIRKVWMKIAIPICAVIGWLALMISPLFFRTINCLDRTVPDISIGEARCGRFGLDYSNLASLDWLPLVITVVIMALAVFIAIKLKGHFSNSWFLVSLAFIACQLICSLFPLNWFTIILTGFWYRDYFRFATTLFFMGSCLFACIPTLIELPFSKIAAPKRKAALQKTIAVLCCLACMAIAFHGFGYRGQFRNLSTTEALSAEETSFMEQVNDIAGSAVVLNNADDNSVWMYPSFDINALIKGRPANQMSSMPDDLCTVIEGIDRIGEDSEYGAQVRAAAQELDLSYVVKMSDKPAVTMKFNELDKIDYQRADAITRVNPSTPGLRLVHEESGLQLYQVDAV